MVKRLIVVSGPGERLMMDVGRGEVRSAPAQGDDVTHIEIAPTPPPEAEAQAAPLPAPWDITMGFVAGAPPGVSPSEAIRVTGPLSFADLARHLAEVPEGGRSVLILGRDGGG